MKNIATFEEFINESKSSKHEMLEKFLNTTLKDEDKGYYWIFTGNTLRNGVLTGNINDPGVYSRHSRSEVEEGLKNDKKEIEYRISLLKKALEEFNKENKTNFKFKYTLNDPVIKTGKWQGSTVYDAPNLIASVTIK